VISAKPGRKEKVDASNYSDVISALQNAVDYAWSKGALIFASAMNNGTATRYYPAACNHAIAVSATDLYDRIAPFSNFGDWIRLAAPGTNILTTSDGGGYAYWNGTSFAAPIAAGVAALVLAANPNLTNDQILNILEQSADDIGPPGFDSSFGWGRVNAWRAVQAALPKPSRHRPPAVTPPTVPQEHKR
jgi:thermitase